MEIFLPKNEETSSSVWNVFGKFLPRLEIVFLCQMIVIYTVIGVALFNLTSVNGEGEAGKIWIVLLSSCLGYLLPNPTIGKK